MENTTPPPQAPPSTTLGGFTKVDNDIGTDWITWGFIYSCIFFFFVIVVELLLTFPARFSIWEDILISGHGEHSFLCLKVPVRAWQGSAIDWAVNEGRQPWGKSKHPEGERGRGRIQATFLGQKWENVQTQKEYKPKGSAGISFILPNYIIDTAGAKIPFS